MIDNNGILMIEPRRQASQAPIIDSLTKKMTAGWRNARHAEDGYRGFHVCICGVCSDNKDHWIGPGQGLLTNSLCVHYMAYHRSEVPADELAKVEALSYGEADPTEEELNGRFRMK